MNDKIGVVGVLGYLKEKKSLFAIILILAAGVFLMVFGSGAAGFDAADTEERIKELCERVDGVSDATVMIVNGADGNVRGVAVVCTGGGDAQIKLILTELITSLFGIPSSSVSVVPGK